MRYALLSLFLVSVLHINAQVPYFQQEVNYKIAVTLNDTDHSLKGNIEIEYTNNSPNELSFIWMHLWPNAYKNRYTALGRQLLENGSRKFYFANDEDRGYIDSLNFKAGSQFASWEYHPEHIDIAKIMLPSPLGSGEKVTISTPFYVKIPSGEFSRLGHIGESYQITQWYPKPAVYDKDGWHPLPYLNMGEFYSEYGSFDVSITLPENYVVGATGDLQNQKEIDWLNRKAEETKKITRFDPEKNEFPVSSYATKTLRYVQKNVHDFAWFADKRWHVLKGEVTLPNSNNKVTTWAMFTNEQARLWENSIEYLNDATYYYSLWNGDYPYHHVTAVDGTISAGGGMEYPNITVIGTAESDLALEVVIMHEVGHNWFYGILGSNERAHAWMDEGINSANELRYMNTKYGKLDFGEILGSEFISKLFHLKPANYNVYHELGYFTLAKFHADQSLATVSPKFTPANYGGMAYSKTALIFNYLKNYLGAEMYDRCMQTYFEKWKFKHPQPNDLQAVFEEVSGKDLGWFFDNLVGSTKKIDYKISSLKDHRLTLKNKANFASPVSYSLLKNDTVVSTVWLDGFDKKKTIDLPATGYDKVVLDAANNIPGINRNNNAIKSTGIFKKSNPIAFRFLSGLDDSNTSTIYYMPVVGVNSYNGFMAGVSFHNFTVPFKKLDYRITPLYSFKENNVNGYANLGYHIRPATGIFSEIYPSIQGVKFNKDLNGNLSTYYTKLNPEIRFDFRKSSPRSAISQALIFGSKIIDETRIDTEADTVQARFGTRTYFESQYLLNKKSALGNFNFTGQLLVHKNFTNVSLEARKRWVYNADGKSFHMRAFAGKFLSSNDHSAFHNFMLNGQSGLYDFAYDQVLMGRSEYQGLFSYQMNDNHGALKVPLAISSNDLLGSFNFKFEAPFPLPLGFFADFAYVTTKNNFQFGNNDGFYSDFGIYAHVVRNIFEIYVPLSYSDNLRTQLDNRNISFGETIRFTLKLDLINPVNIARDTFF